MLSVFPAQFSMVKCTDRRGLHRKIHLTRSQVYTCPKSFMFSFEWEPLKFAISREVVLSSGQGRQITTLLNLRFVCQAHTIMPLWWSGTAALATRLQAAPWRWGCHHRMQRQTKMIKAAKNDQMRVPSGSAESAKEDKMRVPSSSTKASKDDQTQVPSSSAASSKDDQMRVPSGSAKASKDDKMQMPFSSTASTKEDQMRVPSGSAKASKDDNTRLPSSSTMADNDGKMQVPSSCTTLRPKW